MGGNALKHLGTARLNAYLYKLLTDDVQARVYKRFGSPPTLIKSYSAKESFGDADFLLPSEGLPVNWVQKLEEEFASRGSVSNGNVVSMEIADFQVDFIITPRHEMEWAKTYFAYNDLGNLMGRIAHKMGFKYGHDGLVKVVRSGDRVLGEIRITGSPSEVFSFMDYDYAEWCNGFSALENIFEYAASSIYFDPAIYLLDNRNHVSRTRDAKRPTYTAYLEWCKDKTSTFDWAAKEKIFLHRHFLEKAFRRWPSVKDRYDSIMAADAKLKHQQKFLNGELVMGWTGATGKELGELLSMIKDSATFAKMIEEEDSEGVKNLSQRVYNEMKAML
jgi:hypothetical protein